MILHFFNPGYEPSARRGIAHYTPTRPVRQLRHDLATLPLYYAAEGEGVLVPEDLPPDLRTQQCVTAAGPDDRILPWGAAPEVPGCSAEESHVWASRERSVALWQAIYDERLFGPMTAPRRVTEIGQVPKAGRWVAKLDFSSSGRGIFFIKNTEELPPMLERQGELFLEPWLDRVADRGYEFVRHADGRIDFLGVNLFTTGEGRYGASLIAPQPEIIARLSETLPSHDDYVAHLLEGLQDYDFHGYTGPFGIDTVVWRDGEVLRLAPSVEINLRRTMGHVSLELARRYTHEGGPTFSFDITSAEGLDGLPLYLTGELREEGPTLLTPILPGTRFVALLRPEAHLFK